MSLLVLIKLWKNFFIFILNNKSPYIINIFSFSLSWFKFFKHPAVPNNFSSWIIFKLKSLIFFFEIKFWIYFPSSPERSDATEILLGADLEKNEYGHPLFADYFYFITGFHGFHVFSGVILLIILLINVIKGTYERRGHYEMVEKIGLYWHFVDLVWVFVFTFFYLV